MYITPSKPLKGKSLLQRIVSPEGMLKVLHIKASIIALFESMLEKESYHFSLERNHAGNHRGAGEGQIVPQFGCSIAEGSVCIRFKESPGHHQFVFRC